MNDKIIPINLNNEWEVVAVRKFLEKFQLQYEQVDYTVVIYDENNNIIASASIFFNLIKCLAIDENYQNHNFSNKIISFLIKIIYDRKYDEVFLLTKSEYKNTLKNLNFTIIYGNDEIVFFTNRKDLLNNYLKYLQTQATKQKAAVLIMNCNPFTLGHQYLISVASKENKIVYILVVKEELSIFPYQVRLALVKKGISKFKNVFLIASSQYLLSRAVFPSYFLQSRREVIYQQASLDANIFCHLIATNLNANRRYLGEEPLSPTTNIYNKVLKTILADNNIELKIIKRYQINGTIVSASLVRALMKKKDFKTIKNLVPLTTYEYLITDAAKKLFKDKN